MTRERERLERELMSLLRRDDYGPDEAALAKRLAFELVVAACAKVARNAALVSPDGGEPTEAEQAVAQAAHDNILATFLPPKDPSNGN